MDAVLLAAAEKRAGRFHDLGRVYKITTQPFLDRENNTVRVVASAPNGDTITVRVVARYGVAGRKVTTVFASTRTPGAVDETVIGTSQIAPWFQDHSAHAPFLRKAPQP